MKLNKLKNFTRNTKIELTNILLRENTELFKEQNYQIPYFFKINVDYDFLKDKFLKTYIEIENLIDFIHNNNHKENNLKTLYKELFELKFLLESLIKSNPQYTKKRFENEITKLYSTFHKRGNYLEFGDELKTKRIICTKLIYKLLISEKRIEKEQRRNFIELFSETKTLEKKIIWNGTVSDLKAFFVVLYDFLIIKEFDTMNLFVSSNFKTKKSDFKSVTYKNAHNKATYNIDFWVVKINNVREKLGIPRL